VKPFRFHYILFYKPYGVLSQFTGQAGQMTLGNFGPFPRNVYPLGRLDADSEGLLLLTNDDELKRRMLDPELGHSRTYLVQVEREPSPESLARLRDGVVIEGRRTRPAHVEVLSSEPHLPPRSKPIRFRKTVPTAWLQVTLTEGRNRQVRKMTASVGHPALRILRTAIGPFSLQGLRVGGSRELTPNEVSKTASGPPAARPRTARCPGGALYRRSCRGTNSRLPFERSGWFTGGLSLCCRKQGGDQQIKTPTRTVSVGAREVVMKPAQGRTTSGSALLNR